MERRENPQFVKHVDKVCGQQNNKTMMLYMHTHLFDVPFSLSRGYVVSPVLCCVHTDSAHTSIVSVAEELQTPPVDRTLGQIEGGVTGTAQTVPAKTS